MNDIGLDVDLSGITRGEAALRSFGDSFAKMVGVVVRENNRMDNAVKQNAKVTLEAQRRIAEAQAKTSNDKWFAEQRRKIAMMEQSARMEQKTANEAAKASDMVVRAKEAEAREVERLKVKYKDGYAAAALYRKMQDEITKAHKLGAISTNQYEAQLESLSAEFTQFANGGAAAGNRFAGAAQGATRRMSSMGVVTQQVGYQVGDFAVQVQSGQSALVAFSQQATQLVGILPLMSDQLGISSGKLIAISAGLGIGIPVITALAGILWTVSQGAQEAEEKTTRFEDALSSARQEVQGMEDDLRLLESRFKDAFQLTLSDNVEAAKKSLEDARNQLQLLNQLAGETSFFGGKRRQQENDEAIAAAEKLIIAAEEELAAAIATANALEIANNLREQSVVFVEAQAEAQEEARKEAEDYLKTVTELEKELGVAEVTALALAGVDLESNISAGTRAAARLAAQLGIALSVAQQVQLTQMSLANKNQVYSGRGSFGMPGENDTSSAFNPSSSIVDQADTMLGLKDSPKVRTSRGSGRKRGGSAGGSAKADQDDFIEKMKEEMELRKDLLKLFGDERDLQEEINRIVKGLGKDKKKYSDEAVEGIAKQNLLLKEQEELYDKSVEQMQSISDNLETSMGQAFTSMIDGTASVEDAFKNMAKSIIDQLIQIFIVEQMVGSIMGSLGGAFGGGGLSSLRPPKLFADGGVVNRATNFAMTDGGMGTMGEAGPEAIMPLKRGANGKLGVQMEGGSSQSVVVHQNFNFTANGDETVKKLISQAAPQIAQLTKNSLLNDRRRGGQTKSVFG